LRSSHITQTIIADASRKYFTQSVQIRRYVHITIDTDCHITVGYEPI